jgi:hypothetical protein
MSAPAFVQTPWALPQSVSSVLLVGPTEEPLTLEEAKLRAAFDDWPAGDPREALLLDYIAAARAQVELDTGLALLTQTRLVTIAGSYSARPIPWQAWPVQSMTDATTQRVLPAGIYDNWFGWSSVWVPGGSWIVVAGWPSAAALRAAAPLLVQAVGILTTHYATLARDLAIEARGSMMPVPMGYEEAIAPYRLLVLA